MNHAKILLIDYDPASIRRTTTPLIKAGYEVEVAKDGVAGLAAFDQVQPDLVLVEAMLPRKHGFEVCQEIKQREQGKKTPVLITTAVCRGRKYRMDALQTYGCDEYIEKPIADEDLVAMIGRFVEMAHERAGEQVREELSAAIDAAAPVAADPGAGAEEPAALEAMTDDEIEARLDAMLLGCTEPAEAPAAPPESVAPPVAAAVEEPAPAPVETRAPEPVEAPEPPEPVEASVDDEMERRVAAMVETPPAPQPAIPEPVETVVPEPAPAAPEPAESAAPSADEEPAEPEPTLEEWTETATPAPEGKKTALAAAAVIVLLLAAGGTVAYLQGWIGGSGRGTEDGAAHAASFATSPAPPQAAAPVAAIEEDAPSPEQRDALIDDSQPTLDDGPVSKPAELAPPVVPAGPDPERVAEVKRQKAAAEQQLRRAAGTMQSSLLTDAVAEGDEPEETVEDIDVDPTELIRGAVPPPVQRGDLVDIASVDRQPVAVEFEQPAYDELARRMRQQGTVVLEVLIDENGDVIDTRLLQEIPKSRLNDAAVRAARGWKFEPAIKAGKAVRVWKRERIEFRL